MQKINHYWKEWRGTFVFIFLFFAFRSVFADWYEIPTGSMKPTIIEGDRVFVNKLAYDIKIPFTLVSLASWDKPKRGEVIVFDSPAEDKRLIKRVVGLPGDEIAIRNNQLYINNQPSRYSMADQSMVADYWDLSKNGYLSKENPVLINEAFDGQASHTITLLPSRASAGGNFGPIKVPEKHYFMMGDNRNNSADSRFIGSVHEKYILGKANKIVLSLQRTDRFLLDMN
ncbi:MAG: signal peptidase I [Gammaproteobacteria bacterium]|nr:signal peptidase I [Gammaproteobacteria bacterium]